MTTRSQNPRAQRYSTKQGQAIAAYLATTRSDHVTVEAIEAHFREDGSPIGRSTIYRQLERMVEAGSARRFETGAKQSACYQYVSAGQQADCQRHFHLKCERCGRLIHQDCVELAGIAEHLKTQHGFTIDPLRTVFYGICAECARKEEAGA
jgi:Fur family ferric uptake transcriptional regulator